MKKRNCLIVALLLLIWFFLDMIGIYFKESYLVTRSWKDDGIFFIIYLGVLLLFIFKEKIGKWLMSIWVSLWFITQFFSHWWISSSSIKGKNLYFKGSIKLLTIKGMYIPDLYHIILHLLIVIVLINMIIYIIKPDKKDDFS